MLIDPELKYCPRCDDEYRSEIEQCAVCEVPLITGTERMAMEAARQQRLAGRTGELSLDDDLVTVHRGTLHDIKQLEVLLEKEKIGVLPVGDDKSCGKGCCPSYFDLKVRREDAREAVQIIEEVFRKNTGLDGYDLSHSESVFNPYASEAVCPACGAKFSTSITTCPDCGLCFG